MKTVKELLEAYNDNYLSKADPRFGAKFPPEKMIPNVLNLRRKAIRIFPDGQKIALYYSPQLDKYVSIPYGPGTQASGIQLSEAPKPPDFSDEVTDDEKEFYTKNIHDRKGKISSTDIQRHMPIGRIVKTKGARAAAKEAGRRYMEHGDTPFYLGTLTGIPIKKLISYVGKKIKGPTPPPTKPTPPPPAMDMSKLKDFGARPGMKESFNLKLKQIREARQYGKVDLATDLASFAPGPAGSAASLASAGLSLSRGDYVGAGLDALGALPVAGYGFKALKMLRKGAKAEKVIAKGSKAEKVAKKTSKFSDAAQGAAAGHSLVSKDSDEQETSDSKVSSQTRRVKMLNAPAPSSGMSQGVVGRFYREDISPSQRFKSNLKVIREQEEIDEGLKDVPKYVKLLYRKGKKKVKSWFGGAAGGAAAGGAGSEIVDALAKSTYGSGDSAGEAAKRAGEEANTPKTQTQFSAPGSFLGRGGVFSSGNAGDVYSDPRYQFGTRRLTTVGMGQRVQESFQNRLNEFRGYGPSDMAIDAASMTPGPLGTFATLGSLGMDFTRGDYLGAALDLGSLIPIGGYAAKGAKIAKVAGEAEKASKLGKIATKGAEIAAKTTVKAAEKAPKIASFANKLYKSGKLAGIAGAAYGTYKVGKWATNKIDQAAEKRRAARNLNKIKAIQENNLEFDNIVFGDTEIKINNRIAKKVINLYESLNKDNKKKIAEMLDEDATSFKKIINFAIRQ